MHRSLATRCIALVFVVTVRSARAQIPEKFENLQFFPKDIARDSLVQVMRGFSFALGVRCQYCHAGGDGISFQGVRFSSDDKPAKKKARFMLSMVAMLNDTTLAKLPERSTPPVRVACATCHHGLAKPATLASTLMETIEKQGIDSAVQQYRDLRQNVMPLGKYDFGEWSINELARSLMVAGKNTEAIRILELNGEFYPKSSSIDNMLGELYLKTGDKDKAIARFRMQLEKEPNNQPLKRRLEQLTGKAP
jgi:tetratricopeptide (TPR) repeat protein